MKRQFIVSVFFLHFFVPALFAKGGGHGSCGHGCGHGHGGVAGAHRSNDSDAFRDLRKKICVGYLVYKGDTLDGVITCADNTVSLKTDVSQDSTYMFDMSDTGLTTVSISENKQTLIMVRLGNKKLYRVFHYGKLTVYDSWYSFNYGSVKFFNKESKVAYDGRTEKLNTFWTTSVKRKLISYVNKVYGSDIKPSAYNRKELLAYVTKLD